MTPKDKTTDERLEDVELALDAVIDRIDNALNLIEKVIGEVKPTIDKLMQSPIIKMMGIKQ